MVFVQHNLIYLDEMDGLSQRSRERIADCKARARPGLLDFQLVCEFNAIQPAASLFCAVYYDALIMFVLGCYDAVNVCMFVKYQSTQWLFVYAEILPIC